MFDKLIGIPFKDKGRDLSGCDCWGLVILVYKLFGVDLPDYKISCFESEDIGGAVEDSRLQWKELESPAAPCLVTMMTDADWPGFVTHLGVFVGRGKFLHTLKKRNSAIERLSHPFFKNKIEGFYEFTG